MKLSDFLITVGGGTGDVTKVYVDGSLATRDVSIAWLYNNKLEANSLFPYATNVSVGLALGAYATNASIATAAFAKNASLSLYVKKAGDAMTGSLSISKSGIALELGDDLSGDHNGISFTTVGSVPQKILTTAAGNDSQSLILGTADTPNNHLVLAIDGNVGIGTTTPNTTLDVSGNVHINTTLRVDGSISVNNKQIKLLGNPTDPSDAINKWFFDTSLGFYATNSSVNTFKINYIDPSLNAKVKQTLFDSSISYLKAYDDVRWIDINRCGFVDESEVSIGFNPTTYVLQLSRTGSTWRYMRAGMEYTFTTDPSVQIANPPSKGMYFVYIDNNNGTLTSSVNPWTLMDATLPVATILWDASLSPIYQLANEKHQSLIDRRIHLNLHTTRGTQFVSGGVLSGPTIGGTTNATNVFGVSQTVIADEDLFLTLPALASPDGSSLAYTCFFRTNSSTWVWRDSSVPYIYGPNNLIEWDNAGTLTEATNSNANFYNWYLLYSDMYGRARYAMIPGRGIYTSSALAQAEDPRTFDMTGYPVQEGVIAYQLTWETRITNTNQGKVRLAATPKKINVATISSVGSGGSTDHNSLAGLQGGTTNEYYHLTNTEYLALPTYATNSSVGLALGAYATNASIATAAFAKNASLGALYSGLTDVSAGIPVSNTFNRTSQVLTITRRDGGTLTAQFDGTYVKNTSLGTSLYYNSGGLLNVSTGYSTTDLWDVSTDTTTVYLKDPSDNVQLSFIEMQQDGGPMLLVDMPIVNPSVGVEQSYDMRIDGSSALKIYGMGSAGALSETAVIMNANYFSLGDARTDGSWRLKIDSSGNLSVEKRVSGSWIVKGNFN